MAPIQLTEDVLKELDKVGKREGDQIGDFRLSPTGELVPAGTPTPVAPPQDVDKAVFTSEPIRDGIKSGQDLIRTTREEQVAGVDRVAQERKSRGGTRTEVAEQARQERLRSDEGFTFQEKEQARIDLGLPDTAFARDNRTGKFILKEEGTFEDVPTPQESFKTELQDIFDQLDKEHDSVLDEFDTFRERSGEAQDAVISAIQSRFTQRRDEMRDINERREQQQERFNIITGTQRFAPITAGGLMTAEETAGMKRIREIDAEERQAIAAAEEAFRQEDFSLFKNKIDFLERKRAERTSVLEKLNEASIEAQETIGEEARRARIDFEIGRLVTAGTSNVNDVLQSLNQSGIRVTAEEVSDTLKAINVQQSGPELTGRAKAFQSFVDAGLIDSSLPIQEQWERYINLNQEDKILTPEQLKLFPSLQFGARESDAMGLRPNFGVSGGTGGGSQALSSTEVRQTRDRIEANTTLLDLAIEYRNIVDEEGFTNRVFGDKKVLGKVNSLRAQMTAAYKDAKTLGTLDEGVLALMEKLIGIEPSSGFMITKNIFGGPAKTIVSQMDSLIETVNGELIRDKEKIGQPLDEVSVAEGEISNSDVSDIDDIFNQ